MCTEHAHIHINNNYYYKLVKTERARKVREERSATERNEKSKGKANKKSEVLIPYWN